MKKLTLLLSLILATTLTLQAQYQYAGFSPSAKLTQMVGYTKVTIEYTRPMARGRKIFGGLVPYDKMWHTGAGGTNITFDRPVTVADRAVPAGTYAFQVFPRRDEWTFVLSTADDGIGRYNPAYDVVNVCVPVKKPGHFYESYTVELDVSPGNAMLYISWTDVQISVPITTPAEVVTQAHIDTLVAAPFRVASQEDYYRAASYLNFNRRDHEKLVILTNWLTDLDKDRYYPFEMQAKAYLRLGKKEQALSSLKKAVDILPTEFGEQTETIATITERLEKIRREIMAM